MVNIPEQAVKEYKPTINELLNELKCRLESPPEPDLEELRLMCDAAIAALTAAAPYMSGVKVKQLEWGELNEGKTFRALLPIIGSIRVEPYGVCGWWEVLWSMPGQCDKLVPDVFDTPEEAKAAAQADYEKRILSALEVSSVHEHVYDELEKANG